MNKELDFPDIAHLEQIRKRLHVDREYGQASVMVGAGFSRNAELTSVGARPFALWRDVAGEMYDALYPQDADEPESSGKPRLDLDKELAIAGSGVLRIAREYELHFGSQALDDLLRRTIPEHNYRPGAIHRALLSLPWSDVFTTNYDTLLERTLPLIYDRKYDVIRTAADIPWAMKPRIVKLHGSFPSHRPFIITDEHFRRYTQDFAPFVNLVQQAIMENVFCLLGFSGDDPNFLHWTGWVRDNLGSAAPPIYLCGVLDLSPSQRQLLESRNIKPIDLSRVFPVADWPSPGERHRAATAWFLKALRIGAPPNRRHWPSALPQDDPSREDPAEKGSGTDGGWPGGLPPVPPGPERLSGPGPTPPLSEGRYDLRDLQKAWAKTRREYPGWLVAPRDSREVIWHHTEPWIEPVFAKAGELSPWECLQLFYELNWRLELTLTPLLTPWGEQFSQTLLQINPFPKLLSFVAKVAPTNPEHRSRDWATLRECWVSVAFAIMRLAREDLDQERFDEWAKRLEQVARLSPEWWARWCYEQALYALTKRDFAEVRGQLGKWPVRRDLPAWELRRAAVRAELGDLSGAREETEDALLEIRSRMQPGNADYSLLSQEGWAMLLHRMVRAGQTWSRPVNEHLDRWERLGIYQCDPRPEIDLLELQLREPPPVDNNGHRTTLSFDPDRLTSSFSFSTGSLYYKARPAFVLVRLSEVVGLPLVCGHTNLCGELGRAAAWMEPYAPLWSVSIMIRANVSRDDMEKRFDRIRIATLPADRVTLLHSYLEGVIRHVREESQSEQALQGMGLACELLSRLAFRLEPSALANLLETALGLYHDERIRQLPELLGTLGPLFKRILFAFNPNALGPFIPKFLDLPIPEAEGFTVLAPAHWPEPMAFVDKPVGNQRIEDLGRLNDGRVITLVEVVKRGTSEARRRAVLRLYTLLELGLLTPNEQTQFVLALWERTDQNGLPSDTGLSPWGLLELPDVVPGKTSQALLCYLRSGTVPCPGPGWSIGTLDLYARTWLNVGDVLKKDHNLELPVEDVMNLLHQVSRSWEKTEPVLTEKGRDVFGYRSDVHRHANLLRELVARVILPRLDDTDGNAIQQALGLIQRMRQAGLETLSTEPLQMLRLGNLDGTAERLERALYSGREESVNGAVWGIFRWAYLAEEKRLSPPPSTLLNELVSVVLMRRLPALKDALTVLDELVRRFPGSITQEQLDKLCTALAFLLEETRVTPEEESVDEGGLGRIPIVDRPRLRTLAAKLSRSILLRRAPQAPHSVEVLQQWREETSNDVLPEVRRVWYGIDDN